MDGHVGPLDDGHDNAWVLPGKPPLLPPERALGGGVHPNESCLGDEVVRLSCLGNPPETPIPLVLVSPTRGPSIPLHMSIGLILDIYILY